MSKVIEINGLGKQYVKRTSRTETYKTLRDMISNRFRKPETSDAAQIQKTKGNPTFWALKDITFDVSEGEVVGVIGRNGAGKSTLLKILTRITTPTTGEAIIRGRVGSLLEVGTGFHPELSGLENVYLNGAILGLAKSEIRKRLDEIIAFSGVEEFIDMPIKRYSTGMQMRLAFSVSAHLDPEVLLIDEVLSTGDAEFQKKCLGKFDDITKSGRTLLLVSHNINIINEICNRVIVLNHGEILEDTSDVYRATNRYLFGEKGLSTICRWDNEEPHKIEPTEYFSINSMFLGDENGTPMESVIPNNIDRYVYIDLDIIKESPYLNFGISVTDESGRSMFWSLTSDRTKELWPDLSVGRRTIRCPFPKQVLNEGSFVIEFIASLHSQGWLFAPGESPATITFNIKGGLTDSPFWRNPRPVLLALVLNWSNV